jgi:hypothetical protein
MLLVVSAINIFQGFVALVDDKQVVAARDQFILVDLTSWGWTLIVFGVVMLAIGLGLLAGQGWARFAAIVVVALHAVIQVGWIGAYPVWALLMIAIDTVILFALTARWAEARTELRADDGRAYASEGQLSPEPARYQRRAG